MGIYLTLHPPAGEADVGINNKMNVPSIKFLSEVEQLFSIKYPESFKKFCQDNELKNILSTYPNLEGGQFIKDIETLKQINSRIGTEQFGDYEMAIVGKHHPKDGMKLWGEILPIYFCDDGSILGFDCQNTDNEELYVWSVHCIVGSSNFESWLLAQTVKIKKS